MGSFKFNLITLLLICTTELSAQLASEDGSNVTGNITDSKNNPLESAAILLLNGSDSSFVSGTATNLQGKFEIKTVKHGKYLLEVTLLGYKKHRVLVVVKKEKVTKLPTVALEEDVHMLKTVTVLGKQQTVELEVGKTIINLASSVLGSQGNTLDAIKNIPGVFIKEDGSILLNGMEGANILINGKPTYLSGENLLNLLRSMPAVSVGKIELITSPTAQFDAAGKSGLINIQTRSIKMQGTTLNLNSGYEHAKFGRGYAGGRFTFQNSKLTLFTDYNHYQGDKNIKLDILRERDVDHGNVMQYTLRKLEEKTDYFRVGADYDITDKISAGVYTSGNIYDLTLPGSTLSEFGMVGRPADSTLYTTNTNVTKQYSYSGSVNLGYKDQKKREADLSLDYLIFNQGVDMIMHSKMQRAALQTMSQDTLKGDFNGDITMLSLQGNFIHPLSQKSLLRAGGKLTNVDIHNKVLYTYPVNSAWKADNELSKRYTYKEQINAAYVQVETQIGAIGLQTGIRMENTHISGTQSTYEPLNEPYSYKNSYTDLFPNLTLQYSFPDHEKSLALLYNRRIKRPTFSDLSPFNYLWDEYTVSLGNPNLKAEYTDNIELVLGYRKSYRATLFISQTSDAIVQSIRGLDNGKVLIYPENMASNTRLGIRLEGGNLVRLPWWRLNMQGNFYYASYSWKEDGVDKESRRFTPSVGINSQFTFPKGWSAEISGFYNGWMVGGQALIHPILTVNTGIQKKVWKEKATIRLFVNDIFFSNRDKMNLSVGCIKGWSNQRHDLTCIGLSVSFNFKHGDQKKKSLRETSIDESKRINL